MKHLTEHTEYRVSAIVAFVICCFFGGNSPAQVVDRVRKLGGSEEAATKTISSLCDKKVLIDETEGILTDTTAGSHVWAMNLMRQWARYGWSAAADYHIETFDYPAISYADGAARDRELMAGYVAAEPDVNRTKEYDDVLASYQAPSTAEALSALSAPFRDLWQEYTTKPQTLIAGRLDVASVSTLCAAVFGCLRTRQPPMADRRAPLLRKTHPSGGARHPTEVYIISVDVSGLPRGVYHFAVGTSTLNLIRPAPDDGELEKLFDGLYRSRLERSFEPAALAIFTSVFERNMYRYREPRTFRTVFMEVGHIATNFELVARTLGFSTYTQHGIADTPAERLLGIDGFTEGVIYGAAIGVSPHA